MVDRSHAGLMGVMSLCSVLMGCEPAPESDAISVDFIFDDEDAAICAGSEAHVDLYISRLFDFFEATLPADFRVPVRVGTNDACTNSSACYKPDEQVVYMTSLEGFGDRTSGTLRHEITHAVIDRIFGKSAPFFNEGLAEAMSRTQAWGLLSDDAALPVGDMLGQEADQIDYTAAAYFVRFLIDTRGLDRFERIFRAAGGPRENDIKALFGDIYGESFESMQAEYLSGAPRCQFMLDMCNPGSEITVDSRFTAVLPISCQNPDFYGSSAPDFSIGTQITLSIAVGGTYRLRVTYEAYSISGEVSKGQLWLVHCGDCEEQSVRRVNAFVDNDIELDAGLYALEIATPFEAIATIDLERLADAQP